MRKSREGRPRGREGWKGGRAGGREVGKEEEKRGREGERGREGGRGEISDTHPSHPHVCRLSQVFCSHAQQGGLGVQTQAVLSLSSRQVQPASGSTPLSQYSSEL